MNDLVSDYNKNERVIIDGVLTISDEVLEYELWLIGVDHKTISNLLKEPVQNRGDIIKKNKHRKIQ